MPEPRWFRLGVIASNTHTNPTESILRCIGAGETASRCTHLCTKCQVRLHLACSQDLPGHACSIELEQICLSTETVYACYTAGTGRCQDQIRLRPMACMPPSVPPSPPPLQSSRPSVAKALHTALHHVATAEQDLLAVNSLQSLLTSHSIHLLHDLFYITKAPLRPYAPATVTADISCTWAAVL